MSYEHDARHSSQEPLTIGVVVPRTGRLAKLGTPLSYAMRAVAPRLTGITNSGRWYDVRLVDRDSESDRDGARAATERLIRDDGARIVLTLAGTQVLPAVADTCEALETPVFPALFRGRSTTMVAARTSGTRSAGPSTSAGDWTTSPTSSLGCGP